MRTDLFSVLKKHRDQLIQSWTEAVRVSLRPAPLPRGELADRMPHFIDEIVCALHPEALPLPPSTNNAEEHGAQRFRLGFDVAEVAREYGLLHECILDLAAKNGAEVTMREQRIIAKWINAGLTEAIVQYVSQREAESERQASEHLGFIAHELRNPLGAALGAFRRLRQRELEQGGRWVEMVERNLVRTADLIDNTLNKAALKAGVELRAAPIDLGELVRDLERDLDAEASGKKIEMVMSTDPGLTVDADPRLLRSAIANLLQNALKFSHEHSKVSVTATRRDDRVIIDVADGCGGLPPGRAEELFTPFVQRAANRTGYGLGLAIALQAAQAHNGRVTVKNAPDVGCIFTIDLPATRA